MTRARTVLFLSLACFAPACGTSDGDLSTDCQAISGYEDCNPGDTWVCYSGPSDTDSVGVCDRGIITCNAEGTAWGDCTGETLPSAEMCDDLDNDCDGTIDESCTCVPGEYSECYDGAADTKNVGVCGPGVHACAASGVGFDECVGDVLPSDEVCGDGLDNDCDGNVDQGCECPPGETWVCYTGPSDTDSVGVCDRGIKTCGADGHYGECVGEITPTTELCNGLDDDCDGAIDDACVTCVPEVCGNDLDDDCDGVSDNGCVCDPGSTVTCAATAGECTIATYGDHQYAFCAGAATYSESVAACGGLGMQLVYIDDAGENTWVVDTALAQNGYVDFTSSSYWISNNKTNSPFQPWASGEPNNVTETCIQLLRYIGQPYGWNDAHCEGWHWGYVCEASNVGACAGGTQTCNADGTGYSECTGAVAPSAEICGDNVDNDCDGETDEGCCVATTETCDGSDNDCDGEIDEVCVCPPDDTRTCYLGPAGSQGVGVCHSGLETCVDGYEWSACLGQVTPGTESCGDGLDNDCDGTADEGCCVPSAEVCGDGVDNDCDGITDERCIGDRAWNDRDQDGIQDPGEGGVAGVVFVLRTASGALVGITTSNGAGAYYFNNVPNGNYYIEAIAPVGFGPSPMDAGPNNVDSDFDSETMATDIFPFASTPNFTLDLGLYSVIHA